MTRIAVFSDVHSNIQAMEAVWADIQSQSPDAVYCLGDLVGYGANPNKVVEFIREQGIPTILGNYDEGIALDLGTCGCVYRSAELERLGSISIAWSQVHTTGENKVWLQSLPMHIRLEDRKPHLLLVHGSPRHINEYLWEDRPDATFERVAKAAETDVLLFGHTHIPYQKSVAGTRFVNTGSVGRPKDGDPRASYALLEMGLPLEIVIRRVEYDVEAAANAIRATDLPDLYAEELMLGDTPADLVQEGAA